jgi:hypothetical protein
LREFVWPAIKILPEKWSAWIKDKRSLSQKIMKKVSVPNGTTSKGYWEGMLAGITNEKTCALCSNLKQGLFVLYEGKTIACDCVLV